MRKGSRRVPVLPSAPRGTQGKVVKLIPPEAVVEEVSETPPPPAAIVVPAEKDVDRTLRPDELLTTADITPNPREGDGSSLVVYRFEEPILPSNSPLHNANFAEACAEVREKEMRGIMFATYVADRTQQSGNSRIWNLRNFARNAGRKDEGSQVLVIAQISFPPRYIRTVFLLLVALVSGLGGIVLRQAAPPVSGPLPSAPRPPIAPAPQLLSPKVEAAKKPLFDPSKWRDDARNIPGRKIVLPPVQVLYRNSAVTGMKLAYDSPNGAEVFYPETKGRDVVIELSRIPQGVTVTRALVEWKGQLPLPPQERKLQLGVQAHGLLQLNGNLVNLVSHFATAKKVMMAPRSFHGLSNIVKRGPVPLCVIVYGSYNGEPAKKLLITALPQYIADPASPGFQAQ